MTEVSVEFSGEDLSDEKEDKYILHINNFDGSLDLLWHLIRKSKIDIMEISISQITEQYIDYLKLMQRLNIKVASEFVLMASELLYYKSKALLPGEEIEDEYFIPPLPADLIQKLLEFKKFQMTSRELRRSYEDQSNIFTRKNEIPEVDEFGEPVIEATLFDLIDAFARLLDSKDGVYTREIEFNEVLVSDRIEYISTMLAEKNQIFFNEVFSPNSSVGEIIASFLAILEMTKGKQVTLIQYSVFGEIIIIGR